MWAAFWTKQAAVHYAECWDGVGLKPGSYEIIWIPVFELGEAMAPGAPGRRIAQ